MSEDDRIMHPLEKMMRDAQKQRDKVPDLVIDIQEEDRILTIYELMDACERDEDADYVARYKLWKYIETTYPQTKGHQTTVYSKHITKPQLFVYYS